MPVNEQRLARRERRAQQTREDIIDSVLRIISERGFSEVTIDRIAADAGMARATIYAHFPGKREELVEAAYARLAHDLVRRTRLAAAALSPRDALLTHARLMFELASDDHIGRFYNISGPAAITGGPARGIGSGGIRRLIVESLEFASGPGGARSHIEITSIAVALVGASRELAMEVASEGLTIEEALAGFERLVAGVVP